MHIAVFCWIQEFWNLEFNQACFNVGTGRRGDGWGRGSIRPKEFALTHTSHFWLEKSYSPTQQMVWCGGNIPLSERKITLCQLLLKNNPYCVNILNFSVLFQLNNSFETFWFNMKKDDWWGQTCLFMLPIVARALLPGASSRLDSSFSTQRISLHIFI